MPHYLERSSLIQALPKLSILLYLEKKMTRVIRIRRASCKEECEQPWLNREMNIEIEYCGKWNYLPSAASLAAELKESFDVEATLIEGGGGVFTVEVDGKLIYSKKETGRFPDKGEVTKLLS